MKKGFKIFSILGLVLMLVGSILFFYSLSENGWKFESLTTVKYERNEEIIEGEFTNINIDTTVSELVIRKGLENKVNIYEPKKNDHEIVVIDGELKVASVDNMNFIENMLNFKKSKITLFLKDEVYRSLKINVITGEIKIDESFSFTNIEIKGATGNVICSYVESDTIDIELTTGNVNMKDVKAKDINIDVSTGNISLNNIESTNECNLTITTGEIFFEKGKLNNFYSKGNSGDIDLINVQASAKLEIERSTGDIEFSRIDASEIELKTTTGDIEGTILTDKKFIVETTTGEKEYPYGTTGGRCEIITTTGDVKITIAK